VIIFGMIEDDLRRSLDPCAPNFFPVCLEVPTVGGIGREPFIIPVDRAGVSGTQISIDLMDERRAQFWASRSILGLKLGFYELLKTIKRRSQIGITGEATQDAKAEAGLFVAREMVRIARQLNATMILLYIGRLDGVEPSVVSEGWMPLPDTFTKRLPEEVVFVDATDAVKDFYAHNPGQKLYLADNVHPNEKAHELFAQVLRQAILARSSLR
jgi:hypothetical protein